MAFTNKDYTIGWIAALPVELAAAKAMMHKPLHRAVRQEPGDTNIYTLGTIAGHNVVLTCLPRMGTNSAARAATNMLRSFPNIKCGLMVGIGGGVPGDLRDIRLGDIVVSNPDGQHGGVIQYDFGTSIQTEEGFVRKGHLNKPPSILLSALRNIQSDSLANAFDYAKNYDDMLKKEPAMADLYARPVTDHLFKSDCIHTGNNSDCSQCPVDALLIREPRTISKVHYGLIGSGNRVLRDAKERDKLRDEEGIMCFEMEASGLMDEFPCLVIRGICDYCDSHKSKEWQPYASAMAAAYAKELLERIPSTTKATDGADRETLAQCRTALNCTHPRFDKLRLEDLKGGLLRDAYKWVLNTQEHATWLSEGGLLWIKGDPGKGKTMLICGVIDELDEAAYFFCQNTLDTNNSGDSVLSGLILAILEQTPSLTHQVQDKIQQARNLPREGAFYVLGEILEELIAARPTTLIIDALDECVTRKEELLRFIVKTSSRNTSRWMVSSRNHLDIAEHLGGANRVSLELNESSVSAAVAVFVDYRVQQLTESKRYDEALAAFVRRYLLEHAHGTFLWVSLVCLNLVKVRTRNTRKQLKQFPSGLESLYQHMMESIHMSDDIILLEQILATLCGVYRPLSLQELSTYIDLESDLDILEVTKELVSDCGSFLTIRGQVVQFIHQSAKDFLAFQEPQHVIPQGELQLHSELFRKSLKNLQSLKRNPYQCTKPGADVSEIIVPDPDPLLQIKYPSIYWLEHLLAILPSEVPVYLDGLDAKSLVHFMKTKFLFWLEALSLLRSFYSALRAMMKLEVRLETMLKDFPNEQSQEHIQIDYVAALIHDGVEFMRYFHDAIDRFPLQIYISGMIFSPKQSFMKKCYQHETPDWASFDFGLIETWPEIVTLHIDTPYSLRWSADASLIGAVGGHRNPKIHVWDSHSGELLYHGSNARDWHFLDNHTVILTEGRCQFLEIWSIDRGICLEKRFLDWSDQAIQKLSKWLAPRDKEPSYEVADFLCKLTAYTNTKFDVKQNAAKEFDVSILETTLYKIPRAYEFIVVTTLTKDCSLIARGLNFLYTVLINYTRDGTCVKTLDWDQRFGKLHCLRFNQDHTMLAAGGQDSVWIWDIASSTVISQISGKRALSVEFSHCSDILAIQSYGIVTLWRWRHSDSLFQIDSLAPTETDRWLSRGAAFHPSASVIFLARGGFVEEWNTDTFSFICRRGPFSMTTLGMCISEDGERLALGQHNDSIELFKVSDVVISNSVHEQSKHPRTVFMLEMRDDLVYVTTSSTLCVLQVSNDLQSIEEIHHIETTWSGAKWIFSPDYTKVIASEDQGKKRTEIWDLTRFRKISETIPHRGGDCICWGPIENQVMIVSPSTNTLFCWDYLSERKISDWYGPENMHLRSGYLLWSPSGAYLFAQSGHTFDQRASIWNAKTKLWATLSENFISISQVAFSPCERYIAYIGDYDRLRVFRLDNNELILKVNTDGKSSLFEFEGEYLKTDRAWYSVCTRRSVRPPIHLNLEQNPYKDLSWIRYRRENIVWLPGAYRLHKHRAVDMGGSKIVFSLQPGQFGMLSIDLGKMAASLFPNGISSETD